MKAVSEYDADILIAGGRYMYTALKANIPFLDINQEREFGYAGYTGMLDLARQLANTIESRVWEAVTRPTPWEPAGTAVISRSQLLRLRDPGSDQNEDRSPHQADVGQPTQVQRDDRGLPRIHGD